MNPSAVVPAGPYPGMYATTDPTKWTTRLGQTTAPSSVGDCCYACWCLPCAGALSKSKVDDTNCCVNLLCFSPCSSTQFIRYEYGINGPCGDDFGYGLFCPCCAVRRAVTEVRVRGGLPRHGGMYGANRNDWAVSLFDCTFCELCCTTICPFNTAHAVHAGLQPAAESCCFDMCCTLPFAWYGQTRQMYGIISDFPCLEDTCLPLICYPCALNRARKQTLAVPLPRVAPAPKTAASMGY